LRETHHDSERRLGASVFTQPTLALPHAPHAASTRADKLRKRLGWEAGILNGDGGKPKGMHWKTYQRLKNPP
jgi:hypothetical protein